MQTGIFGIVYSFGKTILSGIQKCRRKISPESRIVRKAMPAGDDMTQWTVHLSAGSVWLAAGISGDGVSGRDCMGSGMVSVSGESSGVMVSVPDVADWLAFCVTEKISDGVGPCSSLWTCAS